MLKFSPIPTNMFTDNEEEGWFEDHCSFSHFGCKGNRPYPFICSILCTSLPLCLKCCFGCFDLNNQHYTCLLIISSSMASIYFCSFSKISLKLTPQKISQRIRQPFYQFPDVCTRLIFITLKGDYIPLHCNLSALLYIGNL